MAISLMLPNNSIASTASSEGSPASQPPPTPLSPSEPYPPPPQTASSTGSGDQSTTNPNASNANNNKPSAPANAAEKRKTSRRANTAERRATHNAVERQRRETLNGRFLDLAALLPNLTSVRRPSKSAIVNSSIALIHAQRRQRATAARELRTLYAQFLSLKAECDEWRVRSGVPPVEDGERSKDFVSLLECREEEEMGEEERGALRMAMSATANSGSGGMKNGAGGMDDDEDDDLVVPSGSVGGAAESLSDGEGYQHVQQQQQQQQAAQFQAQAQAQAQVAQQVQAQQAQAQYHQQMRTRAATFSHPPGVVSPVNGHGHGHHPYAAAYHGIPRPGSHGGLPSHGGHQFAHQHPHPHSHQQQQQQHISHRPHGHGHVLPFDNGSDLILAGEPHLSHPAHEPFISAGGMEAFNPAVGSAPHTPGLEMLYGQADWAAPHMTHGHGHGHPFAHGGHNVHGGFASSGMPTPFDDGASTHSSASGPGAALSSASSSSAATPPASHTIGGDGPSPRSSPLASDSGRSRAGSLADSVGPIGMNAKSASNQFGMPIGVGGGSMGGNTVMSMFF